MSVGRHDRLADGCGYVVSTCPAGAEKVRVTADGGEVARIVRGRVPAEVALAERRRPFVASQLPPRSPLGSPG